MESLHKKIHDKLLGVRNSIDRKDRSWKGYTVQQLANDVLFDLAIASEAGELTQEQYTHFEETQRREILNEFLVEARDSLNQNRNEYEVDASKPAWRGWTDKERLQEKNVYRLTRAQLREKHQVEDWHKKHPTLSKVNVDDVTYAIFLRANDLEHMQGSEVTWDDLEPITGNDVYSRREALMRGSQL